MTVKLSPAIVMTPVLLSAPGFALTEKVTVPLPFPLAPAERLIQGAAGSTDAVQLQPDAAVTLTDGNGEPEAAAERVTAVADRLKEHTPDTEETPDKTQVSCGNEPPGAIPPNSVSLPVAVS